MRSILAGAERAGWNDRFLLLEKGANVNSKNKDGKTALDLAKDAEKNEAIKLLKKAVGKE
jgi:ankyrin repeat protein